MYSYNVVYETSKRINPSHVTTVIKSSKVNGILYA